MAILITKPWPYYWPVDCIRAESPENDNFWIFFGFGEFVGGFDTFTGKISPIPTFRCYFLAQAVRKNAIQNWMALGKFGFTRHGEVWDGFTVGLEQKYIQKCRSRRDLYLGRPNKLKKRQIKLKNLEITIFCLVCPGTIHRPEAETLFLKI